MLAQEHVEHDAVDLVVRAVVGEDTDFLPRLAEPVHAAVALLVSGRIPREIVVDHGVELLLEVDAFAKAVRADENPRCGRVTAEGLDTRSAFFGGELTGDASDLHFSKAVAQFSSDVFRGPDEATKDDGLVAVTEQRFEARQQFS